MDFDFLASIAVKAGKAILDVYGTDFEVRSKDDESPLTLADTRSHFIIAESLKERYPDIPVLSEEGKQEPFETRRSWCRFWLIDPLDGTKEFVKRNGEFSVNIAMVENGKPLLGVIYVPVADRLIMADVREGCWDVNGNVRRKLEVAPIAADKPVRVVRSRSHQSTEVLELLSLIPSHEIIEKGSSLKFCAIAEGEADFYPRFGPTWEWDTAAGQAIVTAAGGIMLNFSGEPFGYNKENLLNGPFIAASNFEWLEESGILKAVSKLVL